MKPGGRASLNNELLPTDRRAGVTVVTVVRVVTVIQPSEINLQSDRGSQAV